MPVIAFAKSSNTWLSLVIAGVIILDAVYVARGGGSANGVGSAAALANGKSKINALPQAINVDNLAMILMDSDKRAIGNEQQNQENFFSTQMPAEYLSNEDIAQNEQNDHNSGGKTHNDSLNTLAAGHGQRFGASQRIDEVHKSRRTDRQAMEPASQSNYFVGEELREANLTAEMRHNLALHRRKRYLVFPEGSSFQMVFDLIIPIVDYTNYLIMGITCAVAWELPSKPPSEILENLREKLNDGTFGLSRRNDTNAANLKYVNTNEVTNVLPEYPDSQVPIYHADKGIIPLNTVSQYDVPIRPFLTEDQHYDRYYKRPSSWQKNRGKPIYYANKHSQQTVNTNWEAANWWTRNKQRVQQHWQDKQHMWQQQQKQQKYVQTAAPQFNRREQTYPKYGRTNRKRIILDKPPQHHIYPVFGRKRRRRRSLNLQLTQLEAKLDDVHLREHLVSRQKLFAKIEKLYRTRGMNGTACVQRALCEAGRYARQQHKQRRPMGFVTELLRAIFVLPSYPLQHQKKRHIDRRYVEAHTQDWNCVQRFHECGHSLWESVEFS